MFRPLFAALLVLLCALVAPAADWPMWRFDAHRSAASPEVLPAELHLQWTRQYSPRVQVWDDPLNHDLMSYDKTFEPIVLGDRMFLSFNDTDKVVALDTRTGEEVWAFYTDGPVRFAPVAWQDRVAFTSDDGSLYCVNAADGALQWKIAGGPSSRKALGNGRVISAWPARGGPVLRDGKIYFCASIWPFMGTFIYAVDAATGRVQWVNDGLGSQFIKQPHNAPSFGGVAPQGALVATENVLLVPGGRSVPAAFNRQTGELLHFNIADGGKGNGGSFVAATEKDYFVHTRLRGVRGYDLKTGKAIKFTNTEPVLAGPLYYGTATNAQGRLLVALDADRKSKWEIKLDASGDLIQAGNRLYAAGPASLHAVDLPAGEAAPRVSWSQPVKGEVLRLLAANGRLFAVTLDGRIMAFGGQRTEARTLTTATQPLGVLEARQAQARSLLESTTPDPAGFALWFGVDDGELIEALLAQSNLRIVAVDSDPAKVERLRRRWDAAGLYGTRVTLHGGDPVSFKAPPYIAHLVGFGDSMAGQLNAATLQAAFASVRPYGGALRLPATADTQASVAQLVEAAQLEKGKALPGENQLLVVREGALPRAADWTHQYGDIGNTVKSDDARVKAPLGILWFGGNSNMDVLPRHGHGPPEQVIGGRMFIQGMNCISARDVYTGRMLWKAEFESLGTFGIYYNETYTNTPLSTIYNQKHIPGANGRGANYIATEDTVYLVIGSTCRLLDARTGAVRQTISLPVATNQVPVEWGYVGIYENVLLGGDGFAHYNQKFGGGAKTNTIEDFSASDGLAAFDRQSGALLWRVAARHSFLHNGIVAGNGRIYCLDKLPKSAEDKLKRRGQDAPANYRIVALDARTGQVVWETAQEVPGSWLGYSRQHDVLLLAGAAASDRLKDEIGQGMTAYRGENGKVLWQDPQRKYTGPCILHNQIILTSANSYQASSGAFNLLDGTPHLVANPLTGTLEPWRISRTYGCNNIIASENLLTFRSGAAGFYDLNSQSGTANLGGFKSGCTANLIVANGVLNAPDFTRTCSCAYQNQTSLALVHMPELEFWTFSQFGLDAGEGDRIRRVGINFGAPGDRRAEDGTLWLEYPSTGGDSPGLNITVAGAGTNYFRKHISQVSGPGLAWVGASGLMNAEIITITPEILRQKITKPASSKDDDDDELSPRAAGKSGGKKEAKAAATEPATPPAPPRNHPAAPYTVRMHFLEPADLAAGQRVFGVALQGRPVLEKFDIVKEAGAPGRNVIKEFTHVVIEKDLRVTLQRAAGSQAGPVLCGIELIAE